MNMMPDQEATQEQVEQAMPMPASLPLLSELQRMAFNMGMHAQHLQTQGQLILQDLWHQHESLTQDATRIEDERARHIAEVNRTFDQRRKVNIRQLESVESQITYYSHDPLAIPVADQPMVLAPPPRQQDKRGGFLKFWRG